MMKWSRQGSRVAYGGFLLGTLVAIAIIAAGCGAQSDPSRAEQSTTVRVEYTGEGFSPEMIEVNEGDTVTFVNSSSQPFRPASHIHPTHQIYPEFDAKVEIAPGESWSFTFDRVGEWRYHNHLNSEQTGRVVVSGEPAPAIAQEPQSELSFVPPGVLSEEDIDLLFTDDEALAEFIRRHGPAAAVEALQQGGRDCHSRAHIAGRLAFEEFGPQAFALSAHGCQSGSFHGATEVFIRDYGTADLASNISLVCSESLNAFFRHQCVHGIGHGLMAWSDYELLDALAACDLLGAEIDQVSCYSGTFMENVVGGLAGIMGHVSRYLSDDPHYPCNILEEKYVGPCYFYQSSRMVQLFGGDFQKVAAACEAAPLGAQYLCFESMGRDVGAASRGNPDEAIQSCSYVTTPENRQRCLSGAVQDWFWDPSGIDPALSFCKALRDSGDKTACYDRITVRAGELTMSAEDLERFCSQLEDDYRRPQNSPAVEGEFPC